MNARADWYIARSDDDPDTDDSTYQDACNSLAVAYDREGDTAELISVVAGAERALDFLISRVDVPSYLLNDLRALLNKQRDIKRQIEREVRAGGAA